MSFSCNFLRAIGLKEGRAREMDRPAKDLPSKPVQADETSLIGIRDRDRSPFGDHAAPRRESMEALTG
jgi:hypothetical protein